MVEPDDGFGDMGDGDGEIVDHQYEDPEVIPSSKPIHVSNSTSSAGGVAQGSAPIPLSEVYKEFDKHGINYEKDKPKDPTNNKWPHQGQGR